MLELAGQSSRRDRDDVRVHALGAVGIRNDQTIVRARNGYSTTKFPSVHAEARLCEKLDYGATVFVARVRRTGEFGLAAPCPFCRTRLRQQRVKRVYYTTDEQDTYGCWSP